LGGEVYHSNHFFLFCFTFFIPCLKGDLPNQDIFSESNETRFPIPVGESSRRHDPVEASGIFH